MADEPEMDPGDMHPMCDTSTATEEGSMSQISRCYVHTVSFQDVGLVWSDQRRLAVNGQLASKSSRVPTATAAASGEELQQEEQELAALRELGLPASFGVSKNVVGRSTHSPLAQGAAWSDDDQTPSPSPALESSIFPQNQWQQALDPGTGHFYYYCEALQQTQWEPPKEGYIPIPIPDPTTAWWLPPETQEYVEQRGEEEHQHHAMKATPSHGAAAAEVVATEGSPYADAVISYCQHHGWPKTSLNEIKKETDDILRAKLDAHLVAARQQQNQEGEIIIEKQKPKPRVETTGLLPHIPQPDPSQHLRFGSSSSSSGEDDGDEQLIVEEPIPAAYKHAEHAAVATTEGAAITTNKRQRRRCRRQRPLQRKAHMEITGNTVDQQEEIVLPPRLHKYWLQRYSLFSKYDQGIVIDEEGWYSVTPEVIAWHHAKRLVASMGSKKKCIAVDAFGGMGGNSIQLALAGCHVIAIEMDPFKASILRHNTQVYGVDDLVEVICGDFLQVASRIKADVVVLSPPWGGPEYSQKEKFDVENMGGNPELGLTKLLQLSFGVMGCTSTLVWLPRSSSLVQIEQVAATVKSMSHITNRCEVEIAALNGVTKAMTVYFGTAAKFRGQRQ